MSSFLADKNPGTQLPHPEFSSSKKRQEMAENKETKHHGSKKRPHRMEVTFSDEEWKILQKKAKESGEKTISNFARTCVLNNGITAIISDQERNEIAQLSKIGSNLWELRKQLYNAGIDGQILHDLELFRQKFAKVIEYYKVKLDSK